MAEHRRQVGSSARPMTSSPLEENRKGRVSLILPWNVAFFSQLERVMRKWPWEPWERGSQTPFT